MNELVLHNIQRTHMKHLFRCKSVFNVHNSHLCAWDNPHVISKCGYEACFSVSGWTGLIEDILMSPMCYLTG